MFLHEIEIGLFPFVGIKFAVLIKSAIRLLRGASRDQKACQEK
jgi:hypothetical protein